MDISNFIMIVMPFVAILSIISSSLIFSLAAVVLFLLWLKSILTGDGEIQNHCTLYTRLLSVSVPVRLFFDHRLESDYCNFYFNTRWAFLLLIIMFASSAISLYIDSFLRQYSFMIGYKNACYKITFVCFVCLISLGLLGVLK